MRLISLIFCELLLSAVGVICIALPAESQKLTDYLPRVQIARVYCDDGERGEGSLVLRFTNNSQHYISVPIEMGIGKGGYDDCEQCALFSDEESYIGKRYGVVRYAWLDPNLNIELEGVVRLTAQALELGINRTAYLWVPFKLPSKLQNSKYTLRVRFSNENLARPAGSSNAAFDFRRARFFAAEDEKTFSISSCDCRDGVDQSTANFFRSNWKVIRPMNGWQLIPTVDGWKTIDIKQPSMVILDSDFLEK